MKFSTKVRYGLKALVDLSMNESETPVMASHLAEKQAVSVKYLERILNSLKKAEIIKSVRGCHGGYVLNKKPEDISIYEIYVAVEGDISVSPCSMGDCPRHIACYASNVWGEINSKIVDILKDYDLATVIERVDDELSF
ncbi:MAG: Rrf2 family transcriptional regulator [Spirochaetales bacterium]|nr:Rrf2 family transcriptional regulator [Spirochaetales bacterium]